MLHKKKISKDSASVGDEPIFKASVETQRKTQEYEALYLLPCIGMIGT